MVFVYEKYNTHEKRKNQYKILTENKIEFKNNIIILGHGSISKVLIYIMKQLVNISGNIFVIDKEDKEDKKLEKLDDVKFIKVELNRDNILQELDFIKEGDIVIDCAVFISSCVLIELCNKKGASYINSSIQCWKDETKTLYDIHQDIKELKNKMVNSVNSNILNSMGCNPGLVSMFMKLGLLEIIKKNELYYEFDLDKNKEGDFWAKIAEKMEVRVIHVSERDTQQSNVPKKINEYCNTWASTIDPFYQEALGLSEISLGTHENENKINEIKDYKEDGDYIVLDKLGMFTKAQSWIPEYNKYVGNITPHDETYTIGKYLTRKDDQGKTIYKPSVYFVYHPCNETFMCLDELKERNLVQQENSRLLTSELRDGCDNVGITFFLNNGEVFWIGSKLSVEESRSLFDNEINDIINATVLQVVSGYLAGLVHIITLINQGKKIGIINPENVPVYDVIEYILPFIGDFVFEKNNDFKLTKIQNDGSIFETKEWNLENFLHI